MMTSNNRILINGQQFAIDLIVFDKDGTLIDLHALYGRRTQHCVAWLCERYPDQADLRADLRVNLLRTLGCEIDDSTGQQRILSNSPMATITSAQLVFVAATVLYQHGMHWHQAYDLADEAFRQTILIPLQRDDLTPCADLSDLFTRLRNAGIQVAVATSDDRTPTTRTLELLGIENLVDAVVCGDDALPSKPSPEVIWQLAQRCAVSADRVMMVGDTDCDMQTGLNAGVACCLGVLSGACDSTVLAQYTDTIVSSVSAIEVLG